MMHSPVRLTNLSLFFPHKICFENFSTDLLYRSRIAVIGRNGCGKTSLLRILSGDAEPSDGKTIVPSDAVIGYVPQVISSMESLSGGERLNESLTQALSLSPNILLLDEPMNHLDRKNRLSLLRMLDSFSETLIVVSHDAELLRRSVDTFWHIDNGSVRVFSGRYDDYIEAIHSARESIEEEIHRLSREKKAMHSALMKEQERASRSRAKGHKSIDQKKWPTIVSHAKADRASDTAGAKRAALEKRKDGFSAALSSLAIPEKIRPSFSLSAADTGNRMLVSIDGGTAGYGNGDVLHLISFSVYSCSRTSLTGDNGSGKSTLVKAITRDPDIITSGSWILPPPDDIGFLDQHYRTFDPHAKVIDVLAEVSPESDHRMLRRILNDFLFRKNEEVNMPAGQLSGGEKARLSLACIALRSPKLLILDEVTNNLDRETREHVVQVLQEYPGAMIVISHDRCFLEEIGVESEFAVSDGSVSLKLG